MFAAFEQLRVFAIFGRMQPNATHGKPGTSAKSKVLARFLRHRRKDCTISVLLPEMGPQIHLRTLILQGIVLIQIRGH
jgi:hypothetical protein